MCLTWFSPLPVSGSVPDSDMDQELVFAALDRVCEDNLAVLCGPSDSSYGAVTRRLVACMRRIQEHGRALEPVVASFTSVYHHYDLDAQTPGNGYRTLVKVGLGLVLISPVVGKYLLFVVSADGLIMA